MPENKKSFEEIMAEMNPLIPVQETQDEGFEEFGLSEEMDREILLHRDAHFGGKFDIMIEYYEALSKGVNPEFELKRIKQLKAYEDETEENLAGLLLTGSDAEHVSRARSAYKTLRDICEIENAKERYPKLIAELILSEEEESESVIENIVKEEKTIVPFLLDLLRSTEFRDPLFPGYGTAPYLAGKCLGLMGEERALFSLFQEVGSEDFDNEHLIIQAIGEIGEKAAQFLLPILRSKPYGFENERAALCLNYYIEDPKVQETSFKLLKDPEVYAHPSLASFLILSLEFVKDSSRRKEIKELLAKAPLSEDLRRDSEALTKAWK